MHIFLTLFVYVNTYPVNPYIYHGYHGQNQMYPNQNSFLPGNYYPTQNNYPNYAPTYQRNSNAINQYPNHNWNYNQQNVQSNQLQPVQTMTQSQTNRCYPSVCQHQYHQCHSYCSRLQVQQKHQQRHRQQQPRFSSPQSRDQGSSSEIEVRFK